MKNLTFITGGARSGKSRLAQELAGRTGKPVCFLATMMPRSDDPEQMLRIANHQKTRPETWQTIECGVNPKDAIGAIDDSPRCIILDCLSLFVSGLLMELPAEDLHNAEQIARIKTRELVDVVEMKQNLDVIMVSNEVGCGVVPETILGRAFRDALGGANQTAAAAAGSAYLCVSGIPVLLKKNDKAATFSH